MLKWKLSSSTIRGVISLKFVAVVAVKIKRELQLLIPPLHQQPKSAS